MKYLFLVKTSLLGSLLLLCLLDYPAQSQEHSDTLNMSKIALLEGQPAKSLKMINKYLLYHAGNSDAWQNKAQAHRQLKEYTKATSAITHALEIDPDSRLYLLQLAHLYYETDKYESCISCVDKLLVKDSLNRSLRILKAQSLKNMKMYLGARQLLLGLYDEDTLNAWNIKQLAVLATRLDSIQEAILWCKRAIVLDSMDKSSCIRLGSLYVTAKMYKEGMNELTGIISRDSSEALLFRFRGALSIMAADFGNAESDFNKAITMGDTSAFCYRHYGLALFKQSKYDEAQEVYAKTVQLDPEDAQAWFYLGFCYKWHENIPVAIECLNKALALSASPGISDVYDGLGQFHSLQRDYQQAIHNYSRAYEWNPENAVPLAEIGMLVDESGGKKEHAKDYYNAFLKQADPYKDRSLIKYINGCIERVNEQLFMEGKLKKDN